MTPAVPWLCRVNLFTKTLGTIRIKLMELVATLSRSTETAQPTQIYSSRIGQVLENKDRDNEGLTSLNATHLSGRVSMCPLQRKREREREREKERERELRHSSVEQVNCSVLLNPTLVLPVDCPLLPPGGEDVQYKHTPLVCC